MGRNGFCLGAPVNVCESYESHTGQSFFGPHAGLRAAPSAAGGLATSLRAPIQGGLLLARLTANSPLPGAPWRRSRQWWVHSVAKRRALMLEAVQGRGDDGAAPGHQSGAAAERAVHTPAPAWFAPRCSRTEGEEREENHADSSLGFFHWETRQAGSAETATHSPANLTPAKGGPPPLPSIFTRQLLEPAGDCRAAEPGRHRQPPVPGGGVRALVHTLPGRQESHQPHP